MTVLFSFFLFVLTYIYLDFPVEDNIQTLVFKQGNYNNYRCYSVPILFKNIVALYPIIFLTENESLRSELSSKRVRI